eukprot:TRINITY_DN622_c0_g1_i1.p1 TRINITY_DN622_c0_g1~~TRINITY_DN622_c0_g1_i1.p1  ORF type:complete len:458 (-),score=128.62 TRINITY_DN622_c0_g1_i1:411-1784(-)
MIYNSLSVSDPVLSDLIQQELNRQISGLELIASENFTSQSVLEANGSCLTNKYSEGYPGHRYYGGNEIIDQIEGLAISRALSAYELNPEEWGVNVQPYSGSPANFAVYTGVLQPHDRIMGLDLPSGGHLTHGFQSKTRKVSATSLFWESVPYQVHPETGLIDFENLQTLATAFRPKMIVAGGSAYPREWDYAKFREICDSVGALLMVDMAHISGLVVGKAAASPFEYADIVTTTTHKSLRGPRAAMIFYRVGKDAKGNDFNLEKKINDAVFPGLQGGPHEHAIAAIATTLLQASTDEFKEYAAQVVKNAQKIGEVLVSKGNKLVTGGTDNHLILWDLTDYGINGSELEYVLELANISTNKNAIYGSTRLFSPKGLRVGSPALTSRGLKEDDMVVVAEFLHRGLELTLEIAESLEKGYKIAQFKAAAHDNEKIAAMREEVEAFARSFPFPGYTPPSEQ